MDQPKGRTPGPPSFSNQEADSWEPVALTLHSPQNAPDESRSWSVAWGGRSISEVHFLKLLGRDDLVSQARLHRLVRGLFIGTGALVSLMALVFLCAGAYENPTIHLGTIVGALFFAAGFLLLEKGLLTETQSQSLGTVALWVRNYNRGHWNRRTSDPVWSKDNPFMTTNGPDKLRP